MDDVSRAPRVLSFQLLNEITKKFSADMKIGGGSYGNVYKGEYTNGEMIAVKVLHYIPGVDDEQFEKEYHNLASLEHKNIVRLVGYCNETQREFLPYKGKMVLFDKTQRVLCFEYMQNGNLHNFLSDESSGHVWHTRYAIIKGICQGLKYLHKELHPPMFHLDLKPANVLLDENMMPKIADFGLSRFFIGDRSQITKSAIGTPGYIPPEYIDAGIISIKFDIFSLGVVIIKIMTGSTGYFRSAEMSTHEFIELVHANWKNKLQTTSVDMLERYCKQVRSCIEMALSCVDVDRHNRPSIGLIVDMLNSMDTVQFLGAPMNDGWSSMYKIRLKKEQEEEHKEKQKAEAHLYTIIKISRDEDLKEQIGKDIYFDLVDHEKVCSFRVQNQLPFSAFKEEVAKEYGIPVQFQRFWLWSKRQNNTYRPTRPLTPLEETQSVRQLRERSNNQAHNAELNLFLEVEFGLDLKPLPPPKKSAEVILLFFKLYIPEKEVLCFVGRLFVKDLGKPLDILSKLNHMAGFTPDEEIELYEEIKSEPNVMCEPVDESVTFRTNQLQDGDIVCFQKSLKADSDTQVRYPDAPSFLEYVHSRKHAQLMRSGRISAAAGQMLEQDKANGLLGNAHFIKSGHGIQF